jgi:hypothetical protein
MRIFSSTLTVRFRRGRRVGPSNSSVKLVNPNELLFKTCRSKLAYAVHPVLVSCINRMAEKSGAAAGESVASAASTASNAGTNTGANNASAGAGAKGAASQGNPAFRMMGMFTAIDAIGRRECALELGANVM